MNVAAYKIHTFGFVVAININYAGKRENKLACLLWRDVEGDGPQIHLAVGVDAGDDEKDAGSLGAAFP
jgi:hypothetical protein